MPFLNQEVKRIRISPLFTAFEHLRRFRDTNPWPPRPHAARAFPPLFPKFSLTCHVLCRRHVLCNICWEFLPVIAKTDTTIITPEKVQTGWGVQTDKQHRSAAAVIHDQTEEVLQSLLKIFRDCCVRSVAFTGYTPPCCYGTFIGYSRYIVFTGYVRFVSFALVTKDVLHLKVTFNMLHSQVT